MKTAVQVMTAVLVLAFATGCGNDGSSPCDNAFCVGLLFPINDDRPFATPLISGAEEARDDINAAGIDEFFGDVVLVRGEEGVENRSAVEKTLDTARDILGRGVRGLVGPTYSSSFEKEYSSGSYANFFDFLTRERIVTVSPSATSSSLTELSRNAGEGNRFFFRTAPSNDLWAKVIAGEAADATGTVLIIYRDGTFGDNLKSGVQSEIGKLARGPSVETVSYEPYGPDDPEAAEKARAVVEDAESVVMRGGVSYVIVIAFDEAGKNKRTARFAGRRRRRYLPRGGNGERKTRRAHQPGRPRRRAGRDKRLRRLRPRRRIQRRSLRRCGDYGAGGSGRGKHGPRRVRFPDGGRYERRNSVHRLRPVRGAADRRRRVE